MGVTTFFKSIFMTEHVKTTAEGWAELSETIKETAVMELCFWACVKIVSGAVSKCEFKTYEKGKGPVKGDMYYQWNVSPNTNQTAAEFINEMIKTLFSNNEVLIFENTRGLWIASSYMKVTEGTQEIEFQSIAYEQEIIGSRKMSDVIFIQLADENVKDIVTKIFSNYKKLISAGMDAYIRNNGLRAIYTVDTPEQGTEEERKDAEKAFSEKVKEFLKNPYAVWRQGRGKNLELKYPPLQTGPTQSKDVRTMIDDIADFNATAFGLPSTLLTGNIENKSNAIDQMLTFCIDPLCGQIAQAINKKKYKQSDFVKGNYLKIDTKSVKHVDLFSIATAIDKLIGSGTFCINDIRKAAGEEPIDEPWANQHFITKNYETIEDALRAIKEKL